MITERESCQNKKYLDIDRLDKKNRKKVAAIFNLLVIGPIALDPTAMRIIAQWERWEIIFEYSQKLISLLFYPPVSIARNFRLGKAGPSRSFPCLKLPSFLVIWGFRLF